MLKHLLIAATLATGLTGPAWAAVTQEELALRIAKTIERQNAFVERFIKPSFTEEEWAEHEKQKQAFLEQERDRPTSSYRSLNDYRYDRLRNEAYISRIARDHAAQRRLFQLEQRLLSR